MYVDTLFVGMKNELFIDVKKDVKLQFNLVSNVNKVKDKNL